MATTGLAVKALALAWCQKSMPESPGPPDWTMLVRPDFPRPTQSAEVGVTQPGDSEERHARHVIGQAPKDPFLFLPVDGIRWARRFAQHQMRERFNPAVGQAHARSSR